MDPLTPFRADPGNSAILLDIDGTLAPIAPHPSGAAVPPATLAILTALVARYGLVGCISGRAAADARRLVPIAGLVFAGNHGLEIDLGSGVELAAEAAAFRQTMSDAAGALRGVAAAVGAWVEDKGATLTIHYREAPDPDRAAARLAAEAVPWIEAAGLRGRWGRMSLEVLPPVPTDKGAAVARLVAGRAVVRTLYAGDDTTDVDAFRVVDVAVAVRSAETPAGLVAAATFAVAGPAGLADTLASLI